MRALLIVGLAVSAGCATQYPLSCRYPSQAGELALHANCAMLNGSRIEVSKDQLKQMPVGTEGLAAAFIEGSWHYVNTSGTTLSVITYDNGPDYFAEGLVRSLIDGKIAYYDATFQEVLPPKYDWGWPFEKGRALVCSGCKKGAPDEYGHIPMIEGRWGYIDRKGNEVVPVKLSASEASKK